MPPRLITIDGETKTLTEWCKIYKIRPTAVLNRIADGMTEELAITLPVRKYFSRKREPKYKICARLKLEGRYEEFCQAKSAYRYEHHCTKDEAFYATAAKFPPLGAL